MWTSTDPRPVAWGDSGALVQRRSDGRVGAIQSIYSDGGHLDIVVAWNDDIRIPLTGGPTTEDGADAFQVIGVNPWTPEDHAADAHEAAVLADQGRHEEALRD